MVPLLRSEHPAGATTLLWLMRAHTYTADTAGDKYVVRLLWCCIVSYSPTGAACINTAHTYRHLLIVLVFILYAFNLYLSKFVFVWRKYQFGLKWLKSVCSHLITWSELLQSFVISLTFCCCCCLGMSLILEVCAVTVNTGWIQTACLQCVLADGSVV